MDFQVPLPCRSHAKRSEHRYRGLYGHSGEQLQAIRFPITTDAARGPPGRRSRPELQALSNSLQLT